MATVGSPFLFVVNYYFRCKTLKISVLLRGVLENIFLLPIKLNYYIPSVQIPTGSNFMVSGKKICVVRSKDSV